MDSDLRGVQPLSNRW